MNEDDIKCIQMIQDTIRQTWCQKHERDSVSAYIHMRDDTPPLVLQYLYKFLK